MSMEPSEQMKPAACPFCGSNECRVLDFGVMDLHVFCEICEARGPKADNDTTKKAIEAWNQAKR